MSGGSGSGPLVPTFHGFVNNSMDGLLLFEACLSGKLHHVPRRPHDRERTSLIKSGSIFIYEENASGIKRWTDGVAWSPSRILGNFLIYRELEKPFPPGEKKRAMKRKRSQNEAQGRRGSEDTEPAAEVNMPPTPPSPKPAPEPAADPATNDSERELDRQLIGSLVDSYGFRPDGLVKKTMSISINGVSHHLVSYYKVEDVKTNQLRRPMDDPRLAGTQVRPELYMKQNFRTPVEDTEHYMVENNGYHHQNLSYGAMMPGGYGMRPGQYAMPSPSYGSMYGTPASAGSVYSPATGPGWSAAPQHPGLTAGYSTNGYGSQSYPDYYGARNSSSSTPQSSMVKTEEPSHSAPGYNHLSTSANSYAGSAARPSPSGYSSMPSQYHSPMRPASTAFPPTSSAPHPSSTGAGPSSQTYSTSAASSGPSPQPYGTSAGAGGSATQAYGPPSASHPPAHSTSYHSSAPAPSYSREGATHTGAAQDQIRSPVAPAGPSNATAAPHASLHAPMQYRSQAYSTQDGASQNEVASLNMGSSYAAPSHTGSAQYHSSGYAGYSTPAQAYRAPIDGSAPSHAQY